MKFIVFWLVTSFNSLLAFALLLLAIYAKNNIQKTSYILGMLLIIISIIFFWLNLNSTPKINIILGSIPVIILLLNFFTFEYLLKQ